MTAISPNTLPSPFPSNKEAASVREKPDAAQGSVESLRQKLRRTLKSGASQLWT